MTLKLNKPLILIGLIGLNGCERVYFARSIKSHYFHTNENSQTHLLVYENGKSGHVKEIFCEFPPGYQPKADSGGRLIAPERVRVKGKAREWMMGSVSYFCETE